MDTKNLAATKDFVVNYVVNSSDAVLRVSFDHCQEDQWWIYAVNQNEKKANNRTVIDQRKITRTRKGIRL